MHDTETSDVVVESAEGSVKVIEVGTVILYFCQ